jgi:hypothetical protein
MAEPLDNTDVRTLTYPQLRLEYERSQWALAHALHKLGGSMTVTDEDMQNFSGKFRVWYSPMAKSTFIKVEKFE